MNKVAFKAGFVALIGAPNAGKSTLLNKILGQKISITSRRPQTTRHRILGIKTTECAQFVFVDTPGMHLGGKKALNKYLNKTADASLAGIDVIVWVKDDLEWDDLDTSILNKLKDEGAPVLLALNKIDRIKKKETLLPFIQTVQHEQAFNEIVPISATTGQQLDDLEQAIFALMPEGDLMFPEDQITDCSVRFMACETVREKIIRRVGNEVPHSLSVSIDQFKVEPSITKIYAVIWVEREGQKNIVIGEKGSGLKEVGAQARHDLEQLLDTKVYLNLWVKVKKNWSDNERDLLQLGYKHLE